MTESRVKKTWLNARISVTFYVLTIIISFMSRKLFLDVLGADFMGLTSTLMNILGFLNLAELGIGSSIGYVLYKPLYEKDQKKLNEIVSVLGFLYKRVGLTVLTGGAIIAVFLPLIFKNTSINFGVIYFAFFSFLASSLIGYFINYKQFMLNADQKNYMVTAYFQGGNIVKTLAQIALVYYTGNYYLWIFLELSFSITYSFILNWKIRKVYPWLQTSYQLGRESYPNNKIIIQKARQMFIHVIATVARSKILPFLIYAFTSLKLVAYYANYTLLISKIDQLIASIIGSSTAGVGNLVAEGNLPRIKHVFWELNALQFFIASFTAFCIYHLMTPFITLWLGSEYVLGNDVLIVIIMNCFISQFRLTTDQFIDGYGLFQDVWEPIVTFIVTIGAALLCGPVWGLKGVLLGELLPGLCIISLWKPYFLFKCGFKEKVWSYWRNVSFYFLSMAIAWSVAEVVLRFVLPVPGKGLVHFLVYGVYCAFLYPVLYLSLSYLLSQGTRSLIDRLLKRKKLA